jgi:hypothetical protein
VRLTVAAGSAGLYCRAARLIRGRCSGSDAQGLVGRSVGLVVTVWSAQVGEILPRQEALPAVNAVAVRVAIRGAVRLKSEDRAVGNLGLGPVGYTV